MVTIAFEPVGVGFISAACQLLGPHFPGRHQEINFLRRLRPQTLHEAVNREFGIWGAFGVTANHAKTLIAVCGYQNTAPKEDVILPNYLIFGLVVCPDYRGQGIAKRLLTHTINYLDELNHVKVDLTIVTETPEAEAFYRHLGFVSLPPTPGG